MPKVSLAADPKVERGGNFCVGEESGKKGRYEIGLKR
jgi:hypothetical protein